MRHSTKRNSHKFNSIHKGFCFVKRTSDDVLKGILVSSSLHGYNDFNIILETQEGLFHSSSAECSNLLKYLLKYRKDRLWNGTVADVGVYRDEMINIHQQGKIALLYVCGVKNDTDYGASLLLQVDNELFRQKINEIKYRNSPICKYLNDLLEKCN